MKLATFLSPETVEAGLRSDDRKGVLEELANLAVRSGGVPDGTDLVTILENREDLGSTGIGGGVAIPHVRLRNLPGLKLAVGRSLDGVDFKAIDGQPVRLFFLLLAPEDSTGDHLKALAGISRLIKNTQVRDALLEARDSEEMLEIIVTAEKE